MVTAFLGLGSNLGNRLAWLQRGCDRLAATPGIDLQRRSALYETAPQGCPSGSPPFLNAVVEVRTSLPPRRLLHDCLAIEGELGRTRPATNAPRTLDIDLLLYGDAVIDTPELQLPHPRLHRRPFVLAPLVELAVDVEHPLLHQPLAALAAALPETAALTPLRHEW